MTTRTAVAAAMVLLLGVAACDARAEGEAPSPSAPPSGGVGVGIPGAPSFQISSRLTTASALKAVAGQDYSPVLEQGGAAGGGSFLNHLGITPDGQLISAANPPPKTGNGLLVIGQSEVRLYGDGGRVRPLSLPSGGGAPHQAFAADADERTVAWMETTSTDLNFMDWRAYAFDRSTATTSLLGGSSSIAQGKRLPIVPGATMLSVSAQMIYWSISYPTQGPREFGAKIVGKPVGRAGPFSTVVERAKLPAASGSDLYYVRSEDVSPGFPSNRYEIRKITPDGKDTLAASGPLGPEQQVTALTAEAEHVSWIVSAPPDQMSSLLFVWDPKTNTAKEVTLGDVGTSMMLAASSRYVAWSNGSGGGDAGQYVLDVRNTRLWRANEAPGLSIIYLAGDYVAWSRLGREPQKPEQNSMLVVRWNPRPS